MNTNPDSSHELRRTALKLSSFLLELSSLDKKPGIHVTTTTVTTPTPMRTVQLPKIEAAVDNNPQLTSANKLAYLRDAIRDPPTQSLLFSGTEHPDYYDDVILFLKKRFDNVELYILIIAGHWPTWDQSKLPAMT